MKKISPDHKWYRDHPNQKPLIHVAPDLGEMEPLCHLSRGSVNDHGDKPRGFLREES